jgi:hypothetical protein
MKRLILAAVCAFLPHAVFAQAPLSVAQGGTGAVAATGTGSAVLATAPTLSNLTVTGACTGCGGSTTITLAPGLTSTPGTPNPGTQTATNGSTISPQFYAISTTAPYPDTGNLLQANGTGAIVFTLPNPGSAGGGSGLSYTFSDLSGHGYSLATTSGTANFQGTAAAAATISVAAYGAVSCTSDGTAWNCIGGTLSASGVSLSANNVFTGTNTFAAVLGSVNVQSGTTYTLTATDCGKTMLFTNASAVTVTIAASIAPASGTACTIAVIQGGASKVSVNGSAVTAASLVSASSYTGTSGTAGAVIDLVLTTVSSAATAYLSGQGS